MDDSDSLGVSDGADSATGSARYLSTLLMICWVLQGLLLYDYLRQEHVSLPLQRGLVGRIAVAHEWGRWLRDEYQVDRPGAVLDSRFELLERFRLPSGRRASLEMFASEIERPVGRSGPHVLTLDIPERGELPLVIDGVESDVLRRLRAFLFPRAQIDDLDAVQRRSVSVDELVAALDQVVNASRLKLRGYLRERGTGAVSATGDLEVDMEEALRGRNFMVATPVIKASVTFTKATTGVSILAFLLLLSLQHRLNHAARSAGRRRRRSIGLRTLRAERPAVDHWMLWTPREPLERAFALLWWLWMWLGLPGMFTAATTLALRREVDAGASPGFWQAGLVLLLVGLPVFWAMSWRSASVLRSRQPWLNGRRGPGG